MSTLRDRAAAAAGREVAERVPEGMTLAHQVQAMEAQFQLAAPRGVEAAQLVRDSLTCLRTVRNLDKAEPKSVLGALMTAAQLGLRPGVLGHCWPLPFWDGRDKCFKAQLVIGYQGLVELAHRSGKVSSLIARTVYENDPAFDVDYGLSDNLVHKPLINGDRGKPIAYYAGVKLTTGGHAFYVMGHDEMALYRDKYAPKNKAGAIVGPWRDEFQGMAHKTCVRQLAKWMPKSTELATAIEVDGAVRVDLSPTTPAAEAAVHVEIGEQPDTDVVAGEVVPESTDDVDPTLDPNWGQQS